MNSVTLNFTVTMESQECCNCGVSFAFPKSWDDHFRKTHQTFYCPAGHGQNYTSETDEERLRKQLTARGAELDRVRADRDFKARELEQAAKKTARLKKRLAAGVCPCCKRTFQQLVRHMHAKHPNFSEAKP